MGVSTSGVAGSIGIFFDRGNPTVTSNAGSGTFTVQFDPGHELGSIRGNSSTLTVFIPDTGHTLGKVDAGLGTFNVQLDPGHTLGSISNTGFNVNNSPTVVANAGTGSFTVQFDPGHTLGSITNTGFNVNNSPTVVANAGTGSFTVQLDPGHTLGNVLVTNTPTVTANAGTGTFTVQFDPGHTLGSISNAGFNVNNVPTVVANAGTGTFNVQLDPGHTLGSISNTGFNVNNSPTVVANAGTGTFNVQLDPGHTLGAITNTGFNVNNAPTITGITNSILVFLPDTGHELGTIRGNTNTLTVFLPDTGHTLGNVLVTNIPTVVANAGTGTFTVQFDPGHTLGAITNTGFNVNNAPTITGITNSIQVFLPDTGHTLGKVDAGLGTFSIGAEARTSDITAVANGTVVRLISDTIGKQIVLLYATPERFVTGQATLTTTADTVVVAAGAAGIRNYITSISASNTSATAVRVDFKDGATVLCSFFLAASGGGAVQEFPVPLRGTAATAFNAALSAAVTDVRVSAQGYTAP